jgi:3-oxoacyl-[acyl-carrier-protein] synthase-3
VSLSEVLPGDPVTNQELADRFGAQEQWLDRMTGNRSRYFCRPDGPVGVPKSTGDLATAAGELALAAGAIDPGSLEFVILATASPDHLVPATVTLVAERLGLVGIPTFQLMSGCSGALQGLYTAQALLRSGLRRGLVIGADTCLSLWPTGKTDRRLTPADLLGWPLSGDGGGAAVVDADDTRPGLVVRHLFVRTTAKGRPPGQVVRWYGPDGAPYVTAPDGSTGLEPMGEQSLGAIERYVPGAAQEVLDELLTVTGWPLSSVENVLTPQLNGILSERIRGYLGVRREQSVPCVADTGDSGNALSLIQLHRAQQRVGSGIGYGGRLLVTAVEPAKWIVAGMALTHQAGLPR